MNTQELLAFSSKLDGATTFASVFGPLALGGNRRKLKYLRRTFDRLAASVKTEPMPDGQAPAVAAAYAMLEAFYEAAKAAVADGSYGTAFAVGTHVQQPLLDRRVRAVRDFVGRETELLMLARALCGDGRCVAPTDAARLTALTGLGGVGKSSLAQEYAWRNRARYAAVWWIRAETADTLLDDLIELGSQFDSGLQDISNRREAARRTLAMIAERARAKLKSKPFLLVYDNVESPQAIENLCPAEGAHVLITTRWANWYGNAREIAVEVLPRPIAVDFLLAHAHRPDEAAAGRLADALGRLPLALAHARAYCWDRKWDFDLYRQQLPRLIKTAPRRAAYPASVHATFQLALENAAAHCPEAERLMGLFSVLAPESIPLNIVGPGTMSAIELGEAVAALTEVSLVKLDKFDDGSPAVTVHRLVQEVMRTRLTAHGGAEATVELAVSLLNDSLPYVFDSADAANWPTWTRLLPHAQAIFPVAPETGKVARKTALLLKHSALYCKARAEYALAEAQFRRALAIAESTVGPEHEDVSFILNDFGNLLTELERTDEAETLLRRALAIEEMLHGPNHPGVAIRLNNLGSIYHHQGRLAEAERLYRRAIAIDDNKTGPENPRLSTRHCNLGRVLAAQGRHQEAEELYRRSLASAEAACGPDHPDVANRLVNLGLNLMAGGRIEEAEAAYRRALCIEEAAFGPNHPYVADDLANLAEVLAATGRVGQAEPLLRRALAIMEATLPAGHSWIARRRRQLEGFGRNCRNNFGRPSANMHATVGTDNNDRFD
jgi:tetratricopeptide (TPR) repeat protein